MLLLNFPSYRGDVARGKITKSAYMTSIVVNF